MIPHDPAAAAIPPSGCPAHTAPGAPTALYGPGFAADPDAHYTHLRRFGPIAPVRLAPGVDALLVTGYAAALEVLRSPETFSKDARRWRALADGRVPPDSPVLPMMAWRPSCLFADGAEHARLRGAITGALARVDPHALHGFVESAADQLINAIAPIGKADLVADYADVLPRLVFSQLFGCPEEVAARMVTGTAGMIDAEGTEAKRASDDLLACLAELVALKRSRPGPDLTSWLLSDPVRLGDEEMLHQLVVLIGAGTVPQSAWIANTLRLLLSDQRFAGDLAAGSVPVPQALDEVLWAQSPMSNFSIHYANRDVAVHGVPVPAGVPVVISLAAANTEPSVGGSSSSGDDGGRRRAGNHAHLAWSAGPHTCPAKQPARVIAEVAVERLLDRLPELDLIVPGDAVAWRPGPFHRCPAALPVHFPPESGTDEYGADRHPRLGGSPWTAAPNSPVWTPPAPTSTPRPTASASRAPRRRWSFPAVWRRGR